MDEKDAEFYTEVSFTEIDGKKYRLYVGLNNKWYKAEVLKETVEERNGYFRIAYEYGPKEKM